MRRNYIIGFLAGSPSASQRLKPGVRIFFKIGSDFIQEIQGGSLRSTP